MNKPESVLKNEKHKLLWDFEMQIYHQHLSRTPALIKINRKKRTCQIVDLAVPANHKVKINEN